MRNVWQTGKIHMEVLWLKGRHKAYYILQMHTDRIWRHLGFWMPFSWISTECVERERRNEKLKGQLEKGRLPLLMSCTSLCLIPNTRCNFARKKTKKTQLQNINLEDIVSSTNLYAPAIAKCLQGNLSTSDLLPVGNKQISNVNGGISFYQEEAKTFAQLLFALGSRHE